MFEQIIDLVGQPPGSLVYHFIILFAVEAAFAIAVGQWMRERDEGTLRLSAAIFVLFLGRIIVLLVSLAAWQGYLPQNLLLPPVERAIDTLTIIAVGWAFITMDDPEILGRNFTPDVVSVMTAGFALIGFGGTYYFWSVGTATEQLFNGLWIDYAWSIAQVSLAVIGLVWMAARIRYVYDPVLKALILVLLGAAPVLHMILPVLGDVSPAVRVGQLIVIPMLAATAYRHVVEQLLHWDEFEPSRMAAPVATPPPPAPVVLEEFEKDEEEEAPELQPKPVFKVAEAPFDLDETADMPEDDQMAGRRLPAAPSTLPSIIEIVDSLGDLLSTLEPDELVAAAPRAVATSLRADIALLALVDENVLEADILGGYDNITQAPLGKALLDLSNHPTIVNSLGRLRQMRLTPQRNQRELGDLYSRLFISHEGPAYLQPLVDEDERIGILIVASPYSKRLLSNDERNLLDRIAPLVTAALLNAENYKAAQAEGMLVHAEEAVRLAQLADELTARSTELSTAERQIEEMKSYIRDLHRQLEEVPQQQNAARGQIEKLLQEIELLRNQSEANTDLQDEVNDLRRQLSQREGFPAVSAGKSQIMFEQQLEETRLAAQTEIATLRARLTQASIYQQEVLFLQEQFASKAREVIQLQTRLTEAEAVASALRDQVGSGKNGMRELEQIQMRVASQAAEIASLKADLLNAQNAAQTNSDPVALRAQAEMDQIDRDAVAQLEAQLAERAALADELSKQLNEKTRAVIELKTHMEEVNTSLRSLEEQLTRKTSEIVSLQTSLSKTRADAQKRITELESQLVTGQVDASAVDEARVQMLEAELAEKAAAIETLETQLVSTRDAMGNLEQQLSATHLAVDAAITEAQQVDSHDEVIASIAQELRTPMSSIMGYTELLLRESVGILGPLQRKFLQRVKANTERLGALLDDLVRITAIDAGSMRLEPETIDVTYAIEEVVMNVANQFSEKGLTLRMAFPEELPAVKADREALLDVLNHLLQNAALASPVQGEVNLTAYAADCDVSSMNADHENEVSTLCLGISVKDSGVGIAPEDQERVFMRKYRADNPLIEGLGDTGVGLSLAKALVDAHSGRIWLESEKGVGTTFHVLLPVEPVTVAGDV